MRFFRQEYWSGLHFPAHKDNLGTTIKFVIFNELSNARNPNNMQILYTVLQHSSELAPKVGPGTPAPAPVGGERV